MVARRAALLGLGALLLAACGASPLPSRLAGLPRSHMVVGLQAARLLDRVHGRDVAPADTSVAEYGRGAPLRVWMSRYSDGVTAQRILAEMLAGMRRDDSPFLRPSEDSTMPGRWTTADAAAHHVLWVTGRTLYWLEGRPELVFRAADELPPPSVGLLT
jgi:hypothetical protein